MDKKRFLEKLDELGLDKSRFCIIAGGAMLMNGLRDKTDDIDIKMGRQYFEEIRSRFSVKESSKFSYLYELLDDVEVAVQEFDLRDMVMIDGYLVESLELQLRWKIKNGRAKDQLDIEKIQRYLQEETG